MGLFRRRKTMDELEKYKIHHEADKHTIDKLEKEVKQLKDQVSHLAGDSLRHKSKLGAKTLNNLKKSKK